MPAHDPEKWSPVFGPDHAQLKFARTNKRAFPMREAERRKARSQCRAAHKRSAACVAQIAARAAFGGRARLSAPCRGSCQVFRPGSVRSRASWQRQRALPGQPAPGRPASGQAGRVSEPPARRVYGSARRTALAPSRGVPSAERPLTYGERGGSLVAYSGTLSRKKGQNAPAAFPFQGVGQKPSRDSTRGSRTPIRTPSRASACAR
jgi:hypothetical protein